MVIALNERTKRLGSWPSRRTFSPKKLGPMFDTRFHFTSCTRSHSFLAKNVFCHGNGRHCLWPTSIERKVSNDFLELRFGEAIFFRLLQVKRELLRVAANDERSNGNQAAV